MSDQITTPEENLSSPNNLMMLADGIPGALTALADAAVTLPQDFWRDLLKHLKANTDLRGELIWRLWSKVCDHDSVKFYRVVACAPKELILEAASTNSKTPLLPNFID